MRIVHLTGETLVLREAPDGLRVCGGMLAVGGLAPIIELLRRSTDAGVVRGTEDGFVLAVSVIAFAAGIALAALVRTTTCMVDRKPGTLHVVHRNLLGADGWGCQLSSLIDVMLEPKFGTDGHTLYRITLVSSSGRRIPLTAYSSAGVAAQMPSVTALRQFLPPTARRRATRATSLPASLDRAQWSRVARFLYLAAAALVVLLAGGGLMAWSAALDAGSYKPVSVTVLTTRVETRISSAGSVLRRPIVVYRYIVDGHVYTSERVTREDGWDSGQSAFDVVNRFVPGERYTAYYDPANANVAFLSRPHDVARYPFALIPLVGLVAVGRAIRTWAKRAPPAGPRPDRTAEAETGLVFIHS
jgi:Protein of unknown function (DUF3592)